MTTRDPRFRDQPLPEGQGHGRDPTQSLSLDARLDDPEAAGDPSHPSLALGTHEVGRAAHARRTEIASPAARVKTPLPPRSGPPPVPQAPTDEPDRVGSVMGSYRVIELLGRGGMGFVYRAEHIKLGREVALKLLRSDYARRRDAVARFFQEARTVNRVRHRNIVDVTDFVELDDGTTFIIMEFLRGESLGNWAQSGIDLPRALAVLVQICDGLGAAHEVGVIHRDLKPDNVFVVPTTDGAELVKLLDFGVAKLVNRDDEDVGFQTAAGSVIGTPAYMSPEQAGGMAVDARSDIYSLGGIMYELFCGQPMFRGRSFGEYVRKHLVEMPPPPRSTPGGAQIDPRLEALIMKCLEKEPSQRFASIVELRDSLIAMLGGMETYLPGLASISGSGVRGLANANVGAAVTVSPLPQLRAIALSLPPSMQQSGAHASHASQQAYFSQTLPPTGIQQGTPVWVWFIGGALAVGIGIVAAVWYAGRADLPPVQPAAGAKPPVSQPAPIADPIIEPTAPRVEVKLESTPAGAVFAEGSTSALCQTPCNHTIDPRDGGSPDQRRFVVRTDGYQDAEIVVDLKGAQRDFQVALAPRAEIEKTFEKTVDKPVENPIEKPVDRPAGKPGIRPRVTVKPTPKRPDDKAARPDDKAAKPDDTPKPADAEPIEPTDNRTPKKPPKRPPGSIDAADTLDPFRQKK
jgi:serine/threonine protein kinase